MALEPGTTLGNFEIVSSLGAGGMGEVYRAKDMKLGRDVAIKLLPEDMAKDPERLGRFEREARTLASLSHPNIVTIHSVEEADGLCFITMEFVDGATLSELTPPGGLPLSRFFELAEPIATAVAVAHERGITHRDIKPENVMVGKDGRVRVLDFGLAKATIQDLSTDDDPTQVLTDAGRLLGTVPYMSPEQVQGRPADHRSDVFSLGIVFYEMASGERPFDGETTADLMSSILRDSPTSITELKADLPRHLARILRRCLEKEPLRRYQSAQDLANDLIDLKREVDSGEAVASRASIAVLPFTNMSADPEQEFFCDGMAEDVINALTRVEDLHVVARTSAFQFKGQDLDIREVGEKLGVSTVLEGSVRKVGNRVRISVQLVNVANGYDLWSERYDRELEDVFAIQDEISASIVDTLKAKLITTKKPEPAHDGPKHTPGAEVYELLLQARFFHGSSSRDGYDAAIRCLERALDLDPDFAAGHAMLAWCYHGLYAYGFLGREEALGKTEHHALRALDLDDDLAEAHMALGNMQGGMCWNWKEAEKEIRRAIELEPGQADSHRQYAQSVLAPLGRMDEALAEMRTAYRLDPLSPVTSRNLAENLYWSGRLDEALRQFQHTLEMDPGNPLTRGQLAAVHSALGEPEKALEIRQTDLRRAGRTEAAEEMGRAFAESGDEGVYRWYLAALEERSNTRSVSPYSRAILHGVLGEIDEAFHWLDKACDERFGLLIFAKVNPWLASLHDDPRWADFLQRMGVG